MLTIKCDMDHKQIPGVPGFEGINLFTGTLLNHYEVFHPKVYRKAMKVSERSYMRCMLMVRQAEQDLKAIMPDVNLAEAGEPE